MPKEELPTSAAAATFLERDFIQCFVQLRHYDTQIWNVFRFAFTIDIGVLGVATSVHATAPGVGAQFVPVARLIVTMSIVLGVILYSLVIRNRVYFVRVCRYINEHRAFFLRGQPIGFPNVTGMYVDPKAPRYHDLSSWQLWISYGIASLNGLLVATLAYLVLPPTIRVRLAILASILFIGAQLLAGVMHLVSHESADPPSGGSNG